MAERSEAVGAVPGSGRGAGNARHRGDTTAHIIGAMASARALTRSEIAQIALPPVVFTVGAILLTIDMTTSEEPGTSAARVLLGPGTDWAMRIIGLAWLANVLRIDRRRRRTPA